MILSLAWELTVVGYLGSQSGRIFSFGSIIYSSRGFIGEIKLCRYCTYEKVLGLNVSFPDH